jgi:hypothetical protein
MAVSAALCVVGAAVAAVTIRREREAEPTVQASVLQPCHEPSRVSS